MSRPESYSGQPALAGRAGLRHGGRWSGGDDREHCPPSRAHDDTRTPAQKIREASHEVLRPVFFALAIIITAYLPIFTLQAVEGSLFKPMAWTVAFALLGALVFAILRRAGAASMLFRKGAKEWQNPLMCGSLATTAPGCARPFSIASDRRHFRSAVFASRSISPSAAPSVRSSCRIWMKAPSGSAARLPPSEGPTASIDFTNKARLVHGSFPEVTQVVSQTGRPDDGTDSAGFFNTEYFVDLKPKKDWRPVFHQNKEELIAAMDQQLEKFPGVIWNYSQPISDNMEEAVSGVKGELAVKLYGDDLRTLESTAEIIQSQMANGERRCRPRHLPHRWPAQSKPRRRSQGHGTLGLNVADVQDAIQTAVGANAVTQVQQGEARYDVTLRYQQEYRDTREAIENIRLLAPSGERVSLASSPPCRPMMVPRQSTAKAASVTSPSSSRCEGRDLGSTVEEAINRVENNVKLPTGYHLEWAGEYASQQRANKRMAIVIPITVLAIFLILYTMFRSAKWAMMILGGSSWPILRSGTWCRG